MSLTEHGGGVHSARAGSAELALRRVGLDGSRLTKIVRKAVLDYYADVGGRLSTDRLDDAISFVRERMLGEIGRYDPELAGGVSVETWVYRRSRPRVIDWLRSKSEGLEFGDARTGSQNRVGLTSNGELEALDRDADTLESAIDRLAGGLSPRDRFWLEIVAASLAQGHDMLDVLEQGMRDLADALAVTMPDDLRDQLRRPDTRAGVAEGFAALFGEAA